MELDKNKLYSSSSVFLIGGSSAPKTVKWQIKSLMHNNITYVCSKNTKTIQHNLIFAHQ